VRLPKDGLFQKPFPGSGKRDGKITIFPPKKLLREHPNETYPPLTLRLVVVSLPGTATDAVFLTTLLDSKKYPRRALRNLYHYRWSEEEFFKTIKEHLRAEEFRGKSVQFIDQELLSTYLYYILTRILMLETARQHDLPVAPWKPKLL
jgi:hypothetical protein